MWTRLRAFSKAIGRVPSALFATIYVLAIPTFAYIYTRMPNGFYHSTVKYESTLDRDADQILGQLRDEIVAQFKMGHGTSTKTVGKWTFNVENIRLHSLKPEDSRLTFKLQTELQGDEDMKGAWLYAAVDVTFDTHVRLAVGLPGDPERTIFADPQLTPETFVVPATVLFPAKFGSLPAGAEHPPQLALSDSLHKKTIAFVSAVRGFPAAATGSFARMFYFSAVTITTLGYGDIVPITNTARVTVAIETILGILLAGLFINSLFQERSREAG